MTKTQHIHKFKRLRYKSGNEIFFCALPDCNVKLNISLALGKRSICWRCGESFIMTEYSLRLAKPHCDNCHKPKDLKDEGFNADNHISIDEPIPPEPLSLSERLKLAMNRTNDLTESEEEI